jgi:hypothetical protein
VCSKYDTKDLPSELAARTRRQQRKAIQNPTKSTPALTPATKGPQQKKFNLETYKYHALGDYATSIRLHGPLDGYSSQLVSHLVLSMTYITLSVIRVNLNIVDQKDSILSFEKEDTLLELERQLVESDYSN